MNKELHDLRQHVSRLNDLLSEPQEGLFTWNEFVAKHWKAISDMWIIESGGKC